VKRIDALYAKRARDLEPLEVEFEKQRTELNRLMGDRAAGPAAIELQVARMEVPRAKMNESYFSMLYRMYLVLDVEQYKKLQLIFERQRDRGRGGGAAPLR
jgi:Spy/CpxP family protein refolding chaperone